MPDDSALAPIAPAGQFGNLALQLGSAGMSPSLRILLDPGMFDRVKQLAGAMARAVGMTPQHLIGKPEACHVIINIALDTGLSPYFVARHTYQTPGGQIGYYGALVQAILEQSGRFIGSPQIQYVGDWSKVIGKFELRTSSRGTEFVKATWTRQDAAGLGVIVRWQVKGEPKPRVWPGEDDAFLLAQCFPLNSPLWGTDPKSQIAYLAIRRFANIAAPGILGAAGMSGEELIDASEAAKNITPAQEPRREDFRAPVTDVTEELAYEVVDVDGEIHAFSSERQATEALRMVLAAAAKRGIDRLDGAWDSNDGILLLLDPDVGQRLVRSYESLRDRVVEATRNEPKDPRIEKIMQARARAGIADGDETPVYMMRTAGFTDDEIALYRRAAQGPIATQNDTSRQRETPERAEAGDPERNPDDADARAGGTASAIASGESEGEAETRRTAAAEPQQRHPNADVGGQRAAGSGRPDTDAQEVLGGGAAGGSPAPSQHQTSQQEAGGPAGAAESPGPAQGALPPNDAQQPAPDGHTRPNLLIPVPLKPSTGRPDYRAWSVALLRPKLRRQHDANELAYLLGDNEQAIEACRNGGLYLDELAGLESDIKAAWDRCK